MYNAEIIKKTDYAIILLTHFGEVNAPVSAQKVAEHYQLPYPMVANILKLLVSSGLIKSTRGTAWWLCIGKTCRKYNFV